jgi:hyperosmotically inducible periplasmic protein
MQAADESLDVQITAELAHDRRTAQEAIDVACSGGRVILTGTVGSAAAKAAAVEVARGVPGVITVDDELVVQAGSRRR